MRPVPESAAKSAAEPTFKPLIPIPNGKGGRWLRPLLLISGVLLILGGLALGMIPGLPGVLIGLPGLLLIGVGSPPVGRWINRQDEKLSPKWRRRLRPKLWRKARRKLEEKLDAAA